jgi:hypothetical protein
VVLLALLAGALTLLVAQAGFAEHGNSGKRAKKHDQGQSALAPAPKHIFVIMLENHSKSSVIDDSNAPFITQLAHTTAMASNYYGVTHPSEPNYVAAISGSNWFVNNDNPANRFDHTNIVDQLEANGLTWGAYMESMPSAGYLGDQWPSNAALYASKHNPFVLFTDIRNDPARLAHDKPYTELANDLRKASTTPNFVWITPNQCHDMHGGVYVAIAGHPETPCPYGSTKDDANDASLKQKADDFVKGAVELIRSSQAWKTGPAAIFIVTDENDYTGNPATDGWESADGCCDSPVVSAGNPDVPGWGGGVYGGGQIPAVVVTNRGKTGGYVDDTSYNHYSLLATIEQVWGLGYLGNASDRAQVPTMAGFLSNK